MPKNTNCFIYYAEIITFHDRLIRNDAEEHTLLLHAHKVTTGARYEITNGAQNDAKWCTKMMLILKGM